MSKAKKLLVVLGATAVGKTAFSIDVAKHFETEILSADSRQIFKEMSIGTAKPEAAELAEVRHHFIDSHHISEEYSVGRYEKEALAVLERIFSTKNTAILAGGSSLYVSAVCRGIDELPNTDPQIRQKWRERLENEGLESLVLELEKVDYEYFKEVDQQNPHRVLRALEVWESTGKPFSSFRQKKWIERPFEIIKIGLERDRAELYKRIDQRVDKMIEAGLLAEATKLWDYRKLNALQTVGYKEIFDFLEQKQTWEKTVELIKQNSRRYAKRQLTWLRSDPEIHWFAAENWTEIYAFLDTK